MPDYLIMIILSLTHIRNKKYKLCKVMQFYDKF